MAKRRKKLQNRGAKLLNKLGKVVDQLAGGKKRKRQKNS
jgi:hypothetical protein